jgi:arylsulfatase A-like enzyme
MSPRFRILLMVLVATFTGSAGGQTRPPNIVILFADDMGYGDPACFGSKVNDTPHLDRMAKEGMRFTSFYAAAPVCSASRAALLTGCYPPRVGILGVLDHRSVRALNTSEITFAEIARQKNYDTACFGKWHLGHKAPFLPLNQGFDAFFGTPYSHDMWPFHPHVPRGYPDLPLIDGESIVQLNPNPAILTTACAERAVRFIASRKDKPFLLYLPFNLPHVPLGVSAKFKDKSRNGIYGDVMMEIDWAVGQILGELRERKLESNTLVIFTSDNGPWAEYGNHGGDKGPLRGSKASTWDGGMRVPMIAWRPGTIPAGKVCDELTSTIDMMPTVAKMIGAEVPGDRVIDGRDIGPLLRGEANAKSPHDAFFFFRNGALEAVRAGDWKLHVQVVDAKGAAVEVKTGTLFNLKTDIGESKDVADQNAAVVERMREQSRQFVEDLRLHSREAGRM